MPPIAPPPSPSNRDSARPAAFSPATDPPGPARAAGEGRRRALRARRVRRRRRAAAAGLAAVLLVGAALAAVDAVGHSHASVPGSHSSSPPGVVTLRVGGATVTLSTAAYTHAGTPDTGALAAMVQRSVPAQQSELAGSAQITYRYDLTRTVALIAGLGARGGSLSAPRVAVASSISAPIVGQLLHNDCEATALQIVLATVGRDLDQRLLQAQLPRANPLDPAGSGAAQVWGDPELGFVGRPDGSGPAGGFGVYQRPVAQLARRHGVALVDVTGWSPQRLFARLLAGHAVLAWVGLSDGPYASWRSPAGRLVTVNFGEHAVALTGVSAVGAITVDNPLSGAVETWTKADFIAKWKLLGSRALST